MIDFNEFSLLILLAFITLFGLFFVTAFSYAIRRVRKSSVKKLLKTARPPFYFGFHKLVHRSNSLEELFFSVSCVQHALRVLYLFFLFIAIFSSSHIFADAFNTFHNVMTMILFVILLVLSLILASDLIPRTWAFYAPNTALRIGTPIASVYLLLFSPFSFLLYKIVSLICPTCLSPFGEPAVSSKEKLLELIRDVDEVHLLNDHDKKLLQSILNFRDRIAREVMVPRIEMFSLPDDMSIKEAAALLEREGYSRVPVYKNTQDHIIGVLMYKDVLTKYMEYREKGNDERVIDAPCEDIVKKVFYTPETKKLSLLLQEFLKKQSHLAVVVDEYGGTSGIVTIEDILEEIVGEIADEYDKEQLLFSPLGKNSWLVDARMNLLDLEEELHIKIPQEGDYDTVAGYIFFRLGTIPQKGTIIHQDDFDLEILSSDAKTVEKVKITLAKNPTTKPVEQEDS